MVIEDGPLPCGGVDVRVNLGCEDAFVSKHFLDDPQVGSILYKMGSERMTESMR